ncbi:MAG TPA: EthD family reductase [Candidatus Sulfomarinibacteraceae bacterium]|nr:EthD family reductase [Candidatus Sulfomarinibacteraceae bacterium]
MFKLVTIYRRVDDEAALEKFFSETHLPLAEQLPGLVKSEVSRVTGKPGGESRFHLMYELYFASRDSYEQAMISQTGLSLIQALTPWWQGKIIDWFYAESFEEETGLRAEPGAVAQGEGQDEEE